MTFEERAVAVAQEANQSVAAMRSALAKLDAGEPLGKVTVERLRRSANQLEAAIE